MPRRFDSITNVSEYWIARSSRTMTVEVAAQSEFVARSQRVFLGTFEGTLELLFSNTPCTPKLPALERSIKKHTGQAGRLRDIVA